jgi:hypothetical protein
MTNLIPEPADGARVVVETGDDTQPLRLYWRDDAEAAKRTTRPDERRWFDSRDINRPLVWDLVCMDATTDGVFLVDSKPWQPLEQPEDETRVAVRLIVEQVIRDTEFDRAEYEQAKTDDELAELIDMHVSDMDGDSVVVEVDGTKHRPF